MSARWSSSSSALLAGRGHDGVQQRTQILHVDQGQAVFIRHAECDIEHAFLHIVEVEHARQQQRAHFGDGGAHGVTLLAEHVPEHGGELVGLPGKPHFARALGDEVLGLADCCNAGQVALDVGGENRNAGAGKALRHHLQRDGLAGAGGAGDKSMPIGERERQPGRLLALADKYLVRSIGQFVVGPGHRIASSLGLEWFNSIVANHTVLAMRLKPVKAPRYSIERTGLAIEQSAASHPKVEIGAAMRTVF